MADVDTTPTPDLDPPSMIVSRVVNSATRLDGISILRDLDASLYQRGLDSTVASVLLPSLRKIGDLWHAQRVGVEHEHLLSTIAESWLRSTIVMYQPYYGSRDVLLVAAPNELHLLPNIAFQALLVGRSVPVCNLGGNIPIDSAFAAAEQLDPRAIVVTAQMDFHMLDAAEVLMSFPRHLRPRLYFGGQAFAADTNRGVCVGTYLGPDIIAAANLIASLDPGPEAAFTLIE